MAEQAANPEVSKKKFPIKTILILTAVLVIEAVAISAAFMLSSTPNPVRAEGAVESELAKQEQPVEELVVAEKFPNFKEGRTMLYDTEVYVKVKRKHHSRVKQSLEGTSAQIRQDLRTLIGSADPRHLREPTLATVTRQIKAKLDDRFGSDDEGKSLIEEVIVTRFTRINADL